MYCKREPINNMDVYETIDELFAQVSQQLQQLSTKQQIASAMHTLKRQIVCTIAIANQLPIAHVVTSLQGMQLPLQNGEIYCDPM